MKVLILASGLSAREVDDYDYKKNGWKIVAVNNGWLAHDDWDHWVRSRDFNGQVPKTLKKGQVICQQYGNILDQYGGHVACGYSITLAASYYALHTFNPSVIGYLGADMNYTPNSEGSTHIYGLGNDIKKNGIPDPDRMVKVWGNGEPNYLNDLYMRFHSIAGDRSCSVFNFSSLEDTRLPYPKADPRNF